MRGTTNAAELFHKSAASAIQWHAHPEIGSHSVTCACPPLSARSRLHGGGESDDITRWCAYQASSVLTRVSLESSFRVRDNGACRIVCGS